MISSKAEFCKELDRLFSLPHADSAIRRLSEQGILSIYLPEIEALKGVTQPPAFHPEGDVFTHTMLMLSHIAWPQPDLGWAILLHDAGKPAARTVDPDGTPHFYGHESLGADLADQILRRLDFPDARRELLVNAVRNHMRFASIDRMKPAKQLKIMRAPGFALELELHRIDCISSNGLLGNYVLMLDLLYEEAQKPPEIQPLLTGKDLIRAGFRPGPLFASLIGQVLEEQKQGRITTKEQALTYIQKQKGS